MMAKIIGVVMSYQIAAGLVEENRLAGQLLLHPGTASATYAFEGKSNESIIELLLGQIESVRADQTVSAVGLAMPGIIREGLIEESPNLPQTKGFHLQEVLVAELERRGHRVPVRVFNDADAIAAGLAATRGHLHRLIRVWNLSHGVGFGRYPWTDGIWEGGHTVVTLDPAERYCGCSGRGHLEGIVGGRAMRLRFLDMEPEEIFAAARVGDARCADFVKLWHRALAAATASSIALEGPGRFFFTGPNARFIEPGRLDVYLHEMVKMTSLQGNHLEITDTGLETGVIGAAVNAEISARLVEPATKG